MGAKLRFLVVLLSILGSTFFQFGQPRPVPSTEQPVQIELVSSTPEPMVLYQINCDFCPPGWGMKSICNATHSTVCTPCPSGTWSPRHPHYRSCMTCCKCGPGLYEDIPCGSTHDTKCDACSNVKGHLNGDFKRKCDWIHAPDTLKPPGSYEDLLGDEGDGELDDVPVEYPLVTVDMTSKELAQLDENDDKVKKLRALVLSDVGQQLIADKLRASAALEVDVVMDDPKIVEEDVNAKYVEETLTRRKEAEQAIEKISDNAELMREKLEKNQENMELVREELETKEENDNVDVDEVRSRLMSHRMQPLAQMVPGVENAISIDANDILRLSNPPKQNNFPPSYHSYDVNALIHGQRRKAVVLLILTCLVIVSTVSFIGCYAREYCRRRSLSYNRVTVVNLSPEEREIVRQSANKLATMEKPPKKHRNGYSPLGNATSETSIAITENPLEHYLNYEGDENCTDRPTADVPVHEVRKA